MTALELIQQRTKAVGDANNRYYAALAKLQAECPHLDVSRWINNLSYDVKYCKLCHKELARRVNAEYSKTGMVTRLDILGDA